MSKKIESEEIEYLSSDESLSENNENDNDNDNDKSPNQSIQQQPPQRRQQRQPTPITETLNPINVAQASPANVVNEPLQSLPQAGELTQRGVDTVQSVSNTVTDLASATTKSKKGKGKKKDKKRNKQGQNSPVSLRLGVFIYTNVSYIYIL